MKYYLMYHIFSNPNIEAFDSYNDRQFFLEKLQETYGEIIFFKYEIDETKA